MALIDQSDGYTPGYIATEGEKLAREIAALLDAREGRVFAARGADAGLRSRLDADVEHIDAQLAALGHRAPGKSKAANAAGENTAA